MHALTKDGAKLGVQSKNIENGLTPGKAAVQILHAIKKGSFESYIGKFSGEKIVLWLSRIAPNMVIRKAVRLTPK